MYEDWEEWLTVYRVAKKKGEVVLDIGASVGETTGMLSGQYEKIIAFEPHPGAFSKLKASMAGRENVELMEVAVTNFDGKAELVEYANSNLYSSIRKREPIVGTEVNNYGKSGSFEVKCMRLDSLKLEKVDFVLIDVEGAEAEVVEGALETLRVQKPRLLIEMHLHLSKDGRQKIEGMLPEYKWSVIRHPWYPKDSFNWNHHYWVYGIYKGEEKKK